MRFWRLFLSSSNSVVAPGAVDALNVRGFSQREKRYLCEVPVIRVHFSVGEKVGVRAGELSLTSRCGELKAGLFV
jgi:hypothetical protein